jgi:hypothetical protein
MLADFQQALTDLTASPPLCLRVREDPSALDGLYRLTPRERDRLLGIARHAGMACACTVYRANRLAPLAMNVPRTCRALGPALRAIVDEFWSIYPEANVHFFVETDRFCRFLSALIAMGRVFPAEALAALAEESAAVAEALAASHIEAARDAEGTANP